MVIISSKPGQLGNMLFLSSAFIANSIQHKYKLLNPAFDEYARYFPKTSSDLLCRYPSQKTIITARWARKLLYYFFYYSARLIDKVPFKLPFIETIHLDWDQSLNLNTFDFIDKAKKKIVFVQGWAFRDEKNFLLHAEEIKNNFTPSKEYVEHIEMLFDQIKQKGDIIIGVHIRRRDYEHFKGGKYFYSVDSYKEIMRKIISIFHDKKVVFLICSDEKLNDSGFEEFNYSFGIGNEIEDLYSFARCDYLIGPPSTYTMWASFYGNVPLCMIKNLKQNIRREDFKLIF